MDCPTVDVKVPPAQGSPAVRPVDAHADPAAQGEGRLVLQQKYLRPVIGQKLPLGHLAQAVTPIWSAKLPLAQGSPAVRPVDAHADPAAQGDGWLVEETTLIFDFQKWHLSQQQNRPQNY